MEFEEGGLKRILLDESYVTENDMARAESFAKKNRTSIVEYLLDENLLTKDLLGQAIAESLKVPYADIGRNPPPREQILKIPQEIAEKYRAVLFAEKKGSVIVATDDPKREGIEEALKAVFGKQKIALAFALPDGIDAALSSYRKSLETRFSKIIEGQTRVAPEIIEEILSDALSFNASDIHFEPQHREIIVRFRVDGVLQEAGRLSREHYENILNRIKVQSHLRIDEHVSAQDGSWRYEKDETTVDLRTSIIPTVEGEKAVLRVLASYVQGFSLADLGLSVKNQEIVEAAAAKPFGMILSTGPTGSGKTTTLYALLKLLNQPDVNITTIEDPVEYKMLGINQIQVNAQTNLTFAKGLRSIVRQDPDIILVGEIRDEETAEIAVNAALTGHLLLSTFHANDAATAVPRLLEMGIEPFLLASTLEVIMAQRLVRKICEHCRHSVTTPIAKVPSAARPAVSRILGTGSLTLYEGKGCPACSNTGFKGRTSIFEIIRITPEMQELILKSPSTLEIWKLARRQGTLSLFEDGLEKVKSGVTSLDELLRVAEPPEDASIAAKAAASPIVTTKKRTKTMKRS
jgi:type II secretory ATPase GspE/PulE/Tfp pilus assembly ATPase PilB-like protein